MTYTPTANYNGADSFTFRVNDGTTNSNTATVSITVTAVNDAPVANGLSVTTAEDTPKAIPLNVSDPDADQLTYAILSGPAHGVLSGTAPNLTYTPTANYNGPDSFTFWVNDGSVNSNIAAVSITVTAVNDAPVLAPIGDKTVDELTILSFTVYATDADGNSLTFSLDAGAASGATITPGGGLFSWTPTEVQGPGSYLITIRVSDGITSDFETITIFAVEVNTAPIAVDDRYTAQTGKPLIIPIETGLLANDSDLENDALIVVVVDPPSKGDLVVNPDGSFTYTPEAGFVGTIIITYRANDGQVNSPIARVEITLTPIPLYIPIIAKGH
jgi:hypothetical protein